MKRLVWRGGVELRMEHVSGPPPSPRKDEVLLKVRAVGICGTDIHILNGAIPLAKPPMILGHEISGDIAAVGSKVTNVRDGDRVTLDAVVGCGHCPLCKRGSPQFCAEGFEFGITRDGGCQEYLVVPQHNVYRIADSVSFEEAAILDMEVYNAIRKCRIEKGDSVLVLGAGPIGLIACQVARILGAAHIVLSDPLKSRLDAAQAIGIADVYLPAAESDAGAELGNGSGKTFDVVVDCAGTANSTRQALKVVRPGGRILLYGVYEHAIDHLDMNQVVLKDLTVVGAQSDRNGWEEVIALVTSRALNLRKLITHRLPLEEGQAAFDLVRNREQAVIKAVLLV
ncbi:MAG TPA: alcohol dehydrogenase catalytic domain-containing protein [Acidobacteriaceae bacterium]|nr:alcohol dehydrogenase catalytic domain-containing protein [Acidobacteriaceae bacterium]